MGGAYYTKLAIPSSYINVLDFKSVKQLAEYLHYLNRNDTAYNEYFKWRQNSPLYFCFLSLFFSITLPADQFTVLILKFGTQDFTDPGLLKIRLILTSLSLLFCLRNCF